MQRGENNDIIKTLKRYLSVWKRVVLAAFKTDLHNRFAAFLFIFGKLIRFFLFLSFIILILNNTKTIAGYNLEQVVVFFLTFNLIDITSQLFLRGVYYFRPLILRGDFDLILVKPINPLFMSLTARTDVLDLITLIPLFAFTLYFFITSALQITLLGLALYFFLLVCAFLIALSFHILVLVVGILTTEVDHLIWIYRDLTGVGRMPVDIYRAWLRSFLTFVIPVGIMMTFPAKALMGILSWQLVLYSVLFSIGLFFVSLSLWRFALKKYTSASS